MYPQAPLGAMRLWSACLQLLFATSGSVAHGTEMEVATSTPGVFYGLEAHLPLAVLDRNPLAVVPLLDVRHSLLVHRALLVHLALLGAQ